MGITTDYIKIEEEENRIKTKVRYSLEINYSHISDCEITMDVKARQGQ